VKILVDADSCPRDARTVILRAVRRTGVKAYFAANHPIPDIDGAQMLLCPAGEGAADDKLASIAAEGDLAVTRDIPLAGRLLAAGAEVLDDRGRIFTRDNIQEFLSLRNFNLELVSSGADYDRNPNYGKGDVKKFAASFDKVLTRLLARGTGSVSV
jgi:uncharacterized protein YaiI (UPF0178 family)